MSSDCERPGSRVELGVSAFFRHFFFLLSVSQGVAATKISKREDVSPVADWTSTPPLHAVQRPKSVQFPIVLTISTSPFCVVLIQGGLTIFLLRVSHTLKAI